MVGASQGTFTLYHRLTQNKGILGVFQIRHMSWMGGELVSHLYHHPGHRWVEDSLRTSTQTQEIRESRNIDEPYRADLRPG
jgi:hypothetical protein